MNLKKKRCIVVLGMHRSGTSVLSGALSLLGIDFSGALYGADNNNAKGYFENIAINKVQNLFLLKAGYSWSDPINLINNIKFNTSEIISDLSNTYQNELVGSELSGFKDPRTSYFIEAWLNVFKKNNIEPNFIICFRSPSAVINSLQARDTLSLKHAELLWLLEYERIFRKIDGYKHVLVNYDDFLENPVSSVKNINSNLELDISYTSDNLEHIASFVDKKLNHGSKSIPLRDCTVKIWEYLLNKSRSNEPGLSKTDKDLVSGWFADVNKYDDWNTLIASPTVFRKWNANLYYKGVYTEDVNVGYVTEKISISNNEWVRVKFLLGEVRAEQLIMDILEYRGEFSISEVNLYTDAESIHCLATYNAKQLKKIVNVWDDGYIYSQNDYIHVIQYGSLCKVCFELDKTILSKTKAVEICIKIESLDITLIAKTVYRRFKRVENLLNIRYWKWKFSPKLIYGRRKI